jgi:predicted regulator of Ras-like GTPase activity (Roadblock/LC7/MglB family)
MAITEKKIIDIIEVLQNNTIQIRNANIIEKDGVEIARTFHRHVLSPGDDITNEDAKVQAIANAIWTEDVVNAYKALIAKPDTNTTQ